MIVGQILVGLTAAQCHMAAPLTAGLTGAKLEIRYANPKWKTLNRLVTFRAGKLSRSVREEDGTVTIPWEVLEKSGIHLTAGITGTDPEHSVVIPTVPVQLCRICTGTQPGAEAGADPTLPIWAQLDERLRGVETNVAGQLNAALEEARNSGAFQGDPATVLGFSVDYQVSGSGTQIPQGSWETSLPKVPQGQYLWTRTTVSFNTGEPAVSHTVARAGMDGKGSVSSVANISPDANGNVPLTAEDIGALPSSGLPEPTAPDQAANMRYVNRMMKEAAPRNLLDNSDFRDPVAQAGLNGLHGYTADGYERYYICDRWAQAGVTEVIRTPEGLQFRLGWAYIYQVLQGIGGKTVTLAYKTDNGNQNQVCLYNQHMNTKLDTRNVLHRDGISLVTFSVPADSDTAAVVLYPADGEVISWIALYEGEYTHDTLPRYRPKGYGAELAECKRYYQKLFSIGNMALNGTYVFGFPFETEMRAAPTVTVQLLDLPEWEWRTVTDVYADAQGVLYIYSDDCRAVAHRVDGFACADL